MQGFRTLDMSNPFIRPTIHLPSMTRHGITAWAHDVINELQRLGVLDAGKEEALDDLFGVYRNLEQFFDWVFQRPRIVSGQVHRIVHPVIERDEIFTILHRLWDDLEWDLRQEKDGAFIDQMIDHLGWLWNIKSNLNNRIRRDQGLLITSSMDTLAEAARYAQPNTIGRGNIIQIPTPAPILSASRPLRPVAPASRKHPRNIGIAPGPRKKFEQTSDNTMQPTQASSFPLSFTPNPRTGHLQLPKYSQLVQGQPQKLMGRGISSYSPQSPKSSVGVQHRLSATLNETSSPGLNVDVQHQQPASRETTLRNLVDLAGDDNYDSFETASMSAVPISSNSSMPETRGNKHPNEARGFASGLKCPINTLEGAKPALGGGNKDSHNTSHSAGGMKSNKSEDSLFNNQLKRTAPGNSDHNAILILESPSPESETMQNLTSQSRSVHLASPSDDSESLQHIPSSKVSQTYTKTISPSRQSSLLTNTWTPINGYKNSQYSKSTDSRKTKDKSLDQRLGIQEGNNDGEIKINIPNSSSGNQGSLEYNSNKKAKLSIHAASPSSDYVSPYPSLSNQKHSSIHNTPTPGPVQKPADGNPVPPKAKSAREI